jgi:phosphoglycerate dehydrogenase-like enzyme
LSTRGDPARTSGRQGTLEVATLYPRDLPVDLLPSVVQGCRLSVRHAHHVDSFAARNAKADGADASLIRRIEAEPSEARRSALARAEVVLALDLPLDLAALAPRVRWVQGYGAGIGQLVRCATTTGAVVSSAAGVGADAVAEFVMARLLQVTRRLRELDERQRRREWSAPRGSVLGGRTMLLLGLGAIGRRVAVLARAFGMRVLAVRRRPELGDEGAADEVHPAAALPLLLPRADVVVLCAPSNRLTSGLVGAADLS